MGSEVPVVPANASTTSIDKENGVIKLADPIELDAGALFVLKSEGSWLHCGYHLTTSVVSPALLSLPFALALLGWVSGLICLTLGALVTFYSYTLLSVVLEHHAKLGQRQLRYRDMARDILGPRWGKYLAGPLQLGLCSGGAVAQILLGGQSLHFVYMLSNQNGTMKLIHFIFLFGTLMLFLAQFPSFHSLRHINLVSLIVCLAYGSCATAGAILIGNSKSAPPKNYSVSGTEEHRSFGTFTAISIIISTYGCAVLPQIQATIAPPVKSKMLKGLCICYAVTVTTYFSTAISGYWAFGNQAMGKGVLANFMGADQKPLLPTWFLLMTNVFILFQVSASTLVFFQPINEELEKTFADPNRDQFSARNVVPRVIFRSIAVIIATLIASMLPFFGDIVAVIGAFACIPLDLILPMVFYNVTFKPSKHSLIFGVNTFIAIVSAVLTVGGAVASIRQLVLDSKMHHLV